MNLFYSFITFYGSTNYQASYISNEVVMTYSNGMPTVTNVFELQLTNLIYLNI